MKNKKVHDKILTSQITKVHKECFKRNVKIFLFFGVNENYFNSNPGHEENSAREA